MTKTKQIEVIERLIATIERADTKYGYCCCGVSESDHHEMHSFMDEGDYVADQAIRAGKQLIQELKDHAEQTDSD